MPRQPQPWYRSTHKAWYIKLGGKQIRLGESKAQAYAEFHRLMATRGGEGGLRGGRGARLTVAEVIDLWLDDRKSEVKPVTWQRYQIAAQDLVNHHGRTLARDWKPLHIDAWLKSHPTWGPSTRGQHATVAKMAARWAAAKGWIESNPLATLRAKAIQARRPAAPDDLAQLLAATEGKPIHAILEFMVATGCRPGEAISLESSRIDFKASVATVRGKRGERAVVLSCAILERLRCQLAKWPEGKVFRNTRGEPWTLQALNCQFRRTRRKHGLGVVVPYHLRGEFASRVYAAGVDGVTVAKLLGHKDTSRLGVLIRHYLTVDDDQLRQAVERAEAPSEAEPSPPPPGTGPGKSPGRPARSGSPPAARRSDSEPKARPGKADKRHRG